MSSILSVEDFDPSRIPWQESATDWIRCGYDYSRGVHEVLFSGAVGSAKSNLGAYLGNTHLLMYPDASLCLARRTMPDLKSTILATLKTQLEGCTNLKEGVHWDHDKTKGTIEICNGSKVWPYSWADKKYKKVRSKEFSAALVEELTENDETDKEAYDELKLRVGRLPHVMEKWIVAMTNPDSPAHWAYKYFFLNPPDTRHIFFSKTRDNPFIPASYVEQLERDLDPKTKLRMLDGEWIELYADVLYYAYRMEKNFRPEHYKINEHAPIHISFDFNIGEGKPMSACLFQFIGDTFHVFDEVIVDGSRTLDIMEEIAARGYLKLPTIVLIHGDATGKRRDTRSLHSDYELIEKFLANYSERRINFQLRVPQSNPPLKTRHNRVNAYCHSSDGRHRLQIYKPCQVLNEGMRLTALKKGGKYIEDDSKRYQHVTTALGYGIIEVTKEKAEMHTFGRWGTGL